MWWAILRAFELFFEFGSLVLLKLGPGPLSEGFALLFGWLLLLFVRTRIEIYQSSVDPVLVADDCGEVVGFVSLHVIPLFHASGQIGRITAMSIRSGDQRKGIGRALLKSLEEIALIRGCERIEVTSGDRRKDDAHLFYQACGYAIDRRRFQKFISDSKEGS